MCVYVCVCVYVCMFVCVYVYMCVYVSVRCMCAQTSLLCEAFPGSHRQFFHCMYVYIV